jgi:hypothetical protein
MVFIDEPETVDLLKTGKHSDFTIQCDDKMFAVHKIVLTTKSEFFRAAIESGFKEGTENKITIRETTPVAVAMVIAYLYFSSESYSPKISEIISHFNETLRDKFTDLEYQKTTGLDDAMGVCLLADRLMLHELRDCADADMGEWLESEWDDPILLEGSVEKVYTTFPNTDDPSHTRSNLTGWIMQHTCIVRMVLGNRRSDELTDELSKKPADGYDKILELAKAHDPYRVCGFIMAIQRTDKRLLSSAEMTDPPTLGKNEHCWR